MYAVIRTGGKQYRVKPGDTLVVEKLPGEAGAKVSFDEVLMVGEGADVTVGAPLVEGASVTATLVETRKGEKVKIFKKIRRQGYRRTTGHRQVESVVRVTGIDGAGLSDKWDGKVELITRAEFNLRARNLAGAARSTPEAASAADAVETVSTTEEAAPKRRAAPRAKAEAGEADAAPAKKTAAKKAKPADGDDA